MKQLLFHLVFQLNVLLEVISKYPVNKYEYECEEVSVWRPLYLLFIMM